MPAAQPRYSKEEFAQRGDAIYEGDIRRLVEAGNEGKFVEGNNVRIVTAYRPSEGEWEDDLKTRRAPP